jgi:hypothetical protein
MLIVVGKLTFVIVCLAVVVCIAVVVCLAVYEVNCIFLYCTENCRL